MSISVLTRAYDNSRTGANVHETELTAAAVSKRGVRRLFSLNLPGDARGAEAQPLIVPDVQMPDGSRRDLVLVATMANRVFAFDANNGALVWSRTLGTPIKGKKEIDDHQINDHWGILSTPVIDIGTGTMYLCAWISDDGSIGHGRHSLHALRIITGQDAKAPIDFEGAKYNSGHGQPEQAFGSAGRKQRASLLLEGGTAFVAFGSLRETGKEARGWIIACDVGTWSI